MSQFDAIMASAGIPALKRVFGDPVTITHGSTTRTVTAIIEPELRYVGDVVDLPETAWRLQCAVADWAEPQRGDRVLWKGENYQVDRLEPTATDAYMITLWLIPYA